MLSEESGGTARRSVHVVPFQVSARTRPIWAPPLEVPPATQNVADAQATASSTLRLACTRSGTGWMVHDVPFQLSARATWFPAVLVS